MPRLLVSVRSAEEAENACAGGADLIDIKEPGRGALGRADAQTVAAVVNVVAGRRPVSAALGELRLSPGPLDVSGLHFGKWGLAGLGGDRRWRMTLDQAVLALYRASPRCGFVAVAYADWRLSNSPRPADVADLACKRRWPAFLLDTYTKDGRGLLDFLSPTEIGGLCTRCRRAGVQVALAGALDTEAITWLRGTAPDWFAVRTAACRDGRRDQPICPERVRRLADLLL